MKGAPSIWKLYYNGSIGGQAILGVPMVRRLKQKYGDALKTWPFETGFSALTPAALEGVDILAAEVFAGGEDAKPMPGERKDQTEIRGAAERLARLDETGKLAALFDAPKGVAARDQDTARTEEGWILDA